MPIRSAPQTQLDRSVRDLPLVGSRYAARLTRLGIATVRDLLWHLPARYEDYSATVPTDAIVPGERVTVCGTVERISSHPVRGRRLTVTTAIVRDESGAVSATWFNQPYLEETLKPGTLVSLAGKATLAKSGLTLSSPQFERVTSRGEFRHTRGLVPIYPETDGVSSRYLRALVQPLLTTLTVPDPLPGDVRERYDLPELSDALRAVHYPATEAAAARARRRLAFDELLLLQLKALSERRLANRRRSLCIPMDVPLMRQLVAALPFPLTHDQRVATTEVLRDMERPFPMNRLLEGDVGSGKTVVATLAATHAARAGYQTVLLAPTEVLAQQHYRTLQSLVGTSDVSTALLTASAAQFNGAASQRTPLRGRIGRGEAAIVVGTHALLEDTVRFANLALVVIDEQHRFGIRQRSALVRPRADGTAPHLLSMTATPIPRTLALTIFGDLDTSLLREKPAGRLPVVTRVVRAKHRDGMYEFVREQVGAGRQVFVICPIIETKHGAPESRSSAMPKQAKMTVLWAQVKAVQDEHEKLSHEVFPDLRVAMLHGRMKAAEKTAVIQEFADGASDILVATSVVEVGVDVPNASVMVVEGADRFGLAQLHQFRGRVGRAGHQSYCFLCATDDGAAPRRLKVLTETNDGFALAEEDMALRGPGEFLGTKQSGLPDLAMAALADAALIKTARTVARALVQADPTLRSHPLLAQRLADMRRFAHLE